MHPTLPFAQVYGDAWPVGAPISVTVMDQCVDEQRYVRGAQLRALLYNQVGGRCRLLSVRISRSASQGACSTGCALGRLRGGPSPVLTDRPVHRTHRCPPA